MTPAEELELLKLKKRKLEIEKQKRAAPAAPSNGESEGEDDSAGEDEGFFERAQNNMDRGFREMDAADRDLGEIVSRGATLGFDDVAAGLGAKAGVLSNGGTPAEAQAAYDEAVAERRAVVAGAKERTGKAGTAAEVAGALATAPLSAAGAIGRGAAVKASPYVARALPRVAQAAKNAASVLARPMAAGAVAGAGFGDSDTLPDAAKDAAVGAALSGAITTAAPVLGRAAGAVVDKAKGAIGSALGKAGQRADELRVLTAGPEALKRAGEVPGGAAEMADVMRRTGMSSGVTTAGRVAERTAATNEAANKVISEIIEATDNGGGVIEGKAIAMALRDKAIAIQRMLGGQLDDANGAIVDRLIESAKQYDKVGPMTMRGAQTRIAGNADVKGLADTAQFSRRANDLSTSAQGDAAAATVRALRGGMDEAAGTLAGNVPPSITSSPIFSRGVPASPTDIYREARRVSQVSGIADDSAQALLERTGRNQAFGLGPKLAAGVGAGVGGAPGAMAGAGIAKAGDVFGRSLRATGAEASRDLAERLLASPSFTARAGQGAELLRRAAGGPPQVLAQTHDQLMATDPAYRNAVRDEEFRAAVAGTPDDMRRARGSIAP